MFDKLHLRRPIDSSSNVDETDTIQTKTTLGELGYYRLPRHGLTAYPDDELFRSIEAFQADNRLRKDGVMRPRGETEQELNRRLAAMDIVYRCKLCGAPHDGVYSPNVCWQCWSKGYR